MLWVWRLCGVVIDVISSTVGVGWWATIHVCSESNGFSGGALPGLFSHPGGHNIGSKCAISIG